MVPLQFQEQSIIIQVRLPIPQVQLQPKDIVAGDFYWAYNTPKGKAIWLAADTTAHRTDTRTTEFFLRHLVTFKDIE